MCDDNWLLNLSEWREEQALGWRNENGYNNKKKEYDGGDGGKKRERLMKEIEWLGVELAKRREKPGVSERDEGDRAMEMESQTAGEDANRKRGNGGREEGEGNKQKKNQQNRGVAIEKGGIEREESEGGNIVLGTELHITQGDENRRRMRRRGEGDDVLSKQNKTKNVEKRSVKTAEEQAAKGEQRGIDTEGEEGGESSREGLAELVATHWSRRPSTLMKVTDSAGPMRSCVRALWNEKRGD
jgi:hypothetical protein